MAGRLSHVIAFDDAPFDPAHRGDVLIVGAVCAGTRLDGVLSARVRRDGANATRVIASCVRRSRFFPQLHAVLLQGITFAGFNVVDVSALHRALGLPVLVVARRRPDFAAIRRALLARVPGGARKWKLIERTGPMEPVAGVYVQRAGITPERTAALIRVLAVRGAMPEPLRTAHLIAGGVTLGASTGRV